MTYAACILWTILLAVWSAHDDRSQIEAGEHLNKPLQWCIRAFGVTAFCVACGLWWMALPMGALFSSVFRFTLNRLRGLDWRYVSPSSWYDWQFIRAYRTQVLFADGPASDQREQDVLRHGRRYEASGSYRIKIHRSGLLAYIVELAFAVLIFVLFV